MLTVGLPGSGKSFLADKLAKANNGQVFSTDDFFTKNGIYKWNSNFIQFAHDWNYVQFGTAIYNGLEYAVIANTNLQAWNMYKYVEFAAKFGFDFELVEPKTKWANNAEECFKRNTHNVPLATIQKMLETKENIKDMEAELRRKFYKETR